MKLYKSFLRASLVLKILFLFLFSTTAERSYAQEDKTPEEETISFAGFSRYPPYSFIKDGRYHGFLPDVANAIKEVRNKNITIDLMEPSEALEMAKNGKYKAILGIVNNEDTRKFFNFSEILYEYEYAIFVSIENIHIVSLDSLEGSVVGILNDSFILNDIEKRTKITIEKTDDITEGQSA